MHKIYLRINKNPVLASEAFFLAAQKVVRTYFQNITGKFFVEAGAMDGEYLSNTLYLEVSFGRKWITCNIDFYINGLCTENRLSITTDVVRTDNVRN